jgi:hypothetical protein
LVFDDLLDKLDKLGLICCLRELGSKFISSPFNPA